MRLGASIRRVLAAGLALGGALSLPVGPSQADCDLPRFDRAHPAESLRAAIRDGFFEQGGCDSLLARRIASWRTSTLGDTADPWLWRRPEVQDTLLSLIAAVRQTTLEKLPPGAFGRAKFEKKIDEWLARLAAQGLSSSPDEEWRQKQLVLFAGSVDEVDLGGALEDSCNAGAEPCLRVETATIALLSAATMIRTALDVPWTNARRATVYELAKVDRRWSAYLSGARAMYPWEMFLNGALAAPHYRHHGFVEPPTRQVLFLHPDAGLQVANEGSDRLQSVVALEGLGFYAWRWSKRDELAPAFGASYVLTWDGDSTGPVAQGVLLHLPRNLSIGVAWKRVNGELRPLYLMSGDVGKLFTHRGELGQDLVRTVLTKAPPSPHAAGDLH